MQGELPDALRLSLRLASLVASALEVDLAGTTLAWDEPIVIPILLSEQNNCGEAEERGSDQVKGFDTCPRES